MSKIFRTFWKSFNGEYPLIDAQEINGQIHDTMIAMMEVENFHDWRELYNQRKALQIIRDSINI